jgi:hypothetical protein
MKRFLLLLLTIALVLPSLLTGCNNKNNGETTPETTTPAETTPAETTPPVDTPVLEVQKKLTTVSITAGNTPAELTASADLASYLQKKGVTVAESGAFPITIAINEELGNDAFRVTAVVGEGNINFDRVFEKAEAGGTKYMMVEQDNCHGEDPFQCLKRSYQYLRAHGFE